MAESGAEFGVFARQFRFLLTKFISGLFDVWHSVNQAYGILPQLVQKLPPERKFILLLQLRPGRVHIREIH
jgi:hypothetical protein